MVAVAAAVIVAGITGAPTIIEKWRSVRPPPPDPAPTAPIPAVPVEPPTDTLRSMITDLQARLTRSEAREDELQERIVTLTRDLATAQARVASLERQVEVLSMGRRNE